MPAEVRRRQPANSGQCFERLNDWLGVNRFRVIGCLIFSWVAIRVFMFGTVANGPLYHMYKWQASDNCFFDEWARALANGDWLNRQPIHPYHDWHQEFAATYFKQHPEKLKQILESSPHRDSTFIAGKALWNEWYGGNTYHQEPLYPYLLAVFYFLTGNGVWWMMVLQSLLGIVSGVLLWLIARRHFDDTIALLTGLLYLFCGVILFQEALILRSSLSVFFTLLTIWTFDRALEKRTGFAFLISGLTIGAAYTLQSVFLIFLLGVLLICFWRARKMPRVFARSAAYTLVGFFLIYSPVIVRNSLVGAPVFSISGVGPVTFVAANVYDTKTISNWAPEAAKCAEIMGETGGRFWPVVVSAIKTHPSAGSYLHLLWSKAQRIIDGLEWPNNENYYFYKELVPALRIAFLNFYWIAWIGTAGLIFSIYYGKKLDTLYLAILLQVSILLGFYVLGRFRTPLVALMLPFAAYGFIECLRLWGAALKQMLAKIAVVSLCFYLMCFQFYRPGVSMLDSTDYNVLYEIAYFDRIKNFAQGRQWDKAIALHREFLHCQPDFVKNIRPNQILQSSSDIDILEQFAGHYQIHSYLYEDSGNRSMAAELLLRHDLLKQIADNSRNRLEK